MGGAPDAVKYKLRLFVDSDPTFREVEDYLPVQRGKAIGGSSLTLKEYQKQALGALAQMRENHETIALLHHATSTGKTVTAVSDATRVGKRTLFLTHMHELVEQAAQTFSELWTNISVGRFVDCIKQPGVHVVCGSIQSVALHLDVFTLLEGIILTGVDDGKYAAPLNMAGCDGAPCRAVLVRF